jgi:cell division transport system permease protein
MQRFKYVLSEVMVGLWRNVTMTIAMIITLTLSLWMLGSGLLMYKQIDTMRNYYFGKIEVSIFLKNDITDAQQQAL